MKRRTLEIWLLAGLFLGPLLAAAVLYFGPWDLAFLPRLQAQGRELLTPPPPLPPLELAEEPPEDARQWRLIYATIAPCDERCRRDWERLTQVHAALGRDSARVLPILLHGGMSRPVANPAVVWGRLDAANEPVVAVLGAQRIADGAIFVVDPLGNVVLAYPGAARQKDLLEDLERLLNVSRIG